MIFCIIHSKAHAFKSYNMAEASETIEKKPLVFDYYDNITKET